MNLRLCLADSLSLSLCLPVVNIANSQEWSLSRSIPELRLVRRKVTVSETEEMIEFIKSCAIL